ncbi:hypothetical protein PI124_g12904 [Phytophthora idaei]|nr:hypothetical protein PI124_g12904 [Phytophthora idaei]
MSPSADAVAARTKPAVATPRVNVVENDSADAAISEPDTTPAEPPASEVPDVDSSPADDSEEHDGDVMNQDGCCCTKCMRNWAKTLTDRMDQLERNVGELKREVGQTITITGS